jgi:hypothetical protein
MNTKDRHMKVALTFTAVLVAILLLGCPVAKVATPTFDPIDGSDLSSGGPLFTVTISCETTGATIFYTLDGTTPTDSSTEYFGPFEFSVSHMPPEIVKAIAIKAGMESSEVGSATYTWDY